MDLINPLNQVGKGTQVNQPLSSNPNLLAQTPATHVGLPRGFWKAMGLDICTVLAAANLGYTYSLYFDDKRTFGILFASAAAYAFLSLFQAFFMANTGRRIFVLLLEVVALIAFFFSMPFNSLVMIVFGAIVFFLWGYFAARSELANGLEVRFFRTARAHMTKFATGLLFALVLLYAPHFTPDKPFVSENAFGTFIASVFSFSQKVYPEIDPNASASKLAERIAASQLQGNESFDKLPDAQKSQAIVQTGRQLMENLSKNMGLKIDAQTPVWRVLYGYMNTLLNNMRAHFGDKFTLAWAVILFVAVRGVAVALIWAMVLVGFLLYQLLLALNFGHITGERRTQEVLELS